MPTLRPKKGNRWMARVVIDGKQVACKMFPPGKKHGPEWRAAKEWEEEQRKLAEAGLLPTQTEPQPAQTPTGYARLLAWGEAYLAHAERTMGRSTAVEKKTHLAAFFAFCRENRIEALEAITKPQAYVFLSCIRDERGAKTANKYRKNLLAAWHWGMEWVEGFPQIISPFLGIKPFPVEQKDRYVPSEEDVVKVLQQVGGQDLVFLLTLYFTGGRRGEIFRLSWERDVRLDIGKIRLSDNKAGNGQKRFRWLDMHPELVKALSWWREARPCVVDNVFMQTHCDGSLGEPYRQRNTFMKRLCERAGVRPFGFHSLRHKSAAITFVTSGLNAAQVLMGHYRATTTDRYVRSAGLYTDHSAIMAALGGSGIGQAVGGLLEKSFPHEAATSWGNCNLGACNPAAPV